ncbi:MAG TPA: murein transglycosylase domain-containing protein [Nitrospiraceae bacterium]
MLVPRQTVATFIASLGLAGLMIGPPATALAGDPLEEINKRFQQRKEAGDAAVLDVQQQYQAQRAAMEAQWKRREQAIATRWQQMKREIENKWDRARQSNEKEWIDYSPSYEARSTVDFAQGVIAITVLVPIGETGSSRTDPAAVLLAMKEAQAEAAAAGAPAMASASAADPAGVMIARAALPAAWAKIVKQFEHIFSKESKAGRPLLANQVVAKSGAPVAPRAAKAFVESEVLPQAVVEDKPMQAQDGVTRAQVTVRVPLASDHLQKRAEVYQDDVTAHAKRHGIDPRLLFAIIHTESYFNPLAQTPAPAYGLMLLVPRGPARDAYNYLYKNDIVLDDNYLQDPAHNVELGAAYLHLLRRQLVPNLEEGDKNNYLVACAFTWGMDKTRDQILKQARVQDLTPTQVFTLLTQKTPEQTRVYLSRVKDRIAMYDALAAK